MVGILIWRLQFRILDQKVPQHGRIFIRRPQFRILDQNKASAARCRRQFRILEQFCGPVPSACACPKLQRVSSLLGLSTGFIMPPRSSARKRAADEPPDEVLRRYVCIYPSAGRPQLAGLDNIDFTRDYLRTFLRNNRAAVVESFEASWASMPTLQLSELQLHGDFLRGYVDDGAETALRAFPRQERQPGRRAVYSRFSCYGFAASGGCSVYW